MKVTLVPFRKVGLALQLAGAVVFGAFLGLAGSGQAMATSEQGAAAVAEVTVEVEAGLVTLDARNAPLEGVLKAIGEAAEFGVTLAHDPELLVTTSFANLPLEKAIRRLAGDISMVMLYAQPDGEGGGGRLAEVRLYPDPDRAAELGNWGPYSASYSEANFQQLMQDFASLETDERFQIIRRLTENQHPAAAVALLKIIFSDRNLRVRRSAAAGLLELPEDQAASALAAALEEEDPEVRMRAVRVLGKAANYKALEPLADALAFDLDSRVRRTVVSTLAALPEMDTADHIDVKGLVEAAARWDTDFGVREAATITFELLRNKIDVVE